MGGEVDIMERLNYDSIVYQTVHSHYTYTLGIENNPKHGGTTSINPEDFNVYGVDFWPDSLVFHVNGKRHFVYPRIERYLGRTSGLYGFTSGDGSGLGTSLSMEIKLF